MSVDVSVVIGFRNWGLERLGFSIQSIQQSLAGVAHEVIVSDFGSVDREDHQRFIQDMGAKYFYTESSRWSRSAALNVGVNNSVGEIVFLTDADMLFSPSSLAKATEFLKKSSQSIALIQCRDLPEEWDAQAVEARGLDWGEFERKAKLRPRWGMGGLIGFSRDSFDGIRGLDERMHTYGGEDLDFAQRMQRAGNRVVWLSEDDVRMYHIWHPSSRVSASLDSDAEAAVQANKQIVEKDPTIIRNLEGKVHFKPKNPLISVVISTFNRGDMIHESISSVLNQTFQDFEVIIIDDGSTDNTKEAVESFNDERIRYFYQENSGISKARNVGSDLARGRYIAVHDDDDMMVPERLAISLRAIRGGIQATFGSWINFDDRTGELFLNVSKKTFNESVVWGIGPAPGHATWLVETSLLRKVRYDESLSSAVDHNLATRLVASGVRWAHTGAVMFVRRKHDRQISESDEKRQTGAALLTRRWTVSSLNANLRKEISTRGKNQTWPQLKEKGNEEEFALPWLTDHLVYRSVLVESSIGDLATTLESSQRIIERFEVSDLQLGSKIERLRLHDVSWRDLATLRTVGASFKVTASWRNGPSLPGFDTHSVAQESQKALIKTLVDAALTSEEKSEWLLICREVDLPDSFSPRFRGVIGSGNEENLAFVAWLEPEEAAAIETAKQISKNRGGDVWILHLESRKR